MRKYILAFCVSLLSLCAVGAGQAYYSRIDGMLSPGIVRAYQVTVDEVLSDGTVNARVSVWSGVEASTRIRLNGISITDADVFAGIIGERVTGRGQVFLQTSEQYDQSGALLGTIFYSTRNGYRDVAMDILSARAAVPMANNQPAIVSQNSVREIRGGESSFPQQTRCASGGSGKINGKKIAIDILGNLLNR